MSEPVLTLAAAAALVFPDGGVTAASLRTEYRKGRLRCFLVAGKLRTTEAAVRDMLSQCRAAPKDPASISAKLAQADPQPGSSETDNARLAQAAAKSIAEKLKKRSRPTSRPNTAQPAEVIALTRSS